MRESLRAIRFIARITRQADATDAAVTLAITMIEAIVRASWPYLLKVFVDAAIQGNLRRGIFAAAGFGSVIAILGEANQARITRSQLLVEHVGFLIDERIMQISMSIATVDHHEDAEYAREMDLLRAHRPQIGTAINQIIVTLMVVGVLGSSVFLLCAVHPILVLLPLFALPSVATGSLAAKIEQRAQLATAEQLRKSERFFEIATSAPSAKEVRVFGIARHLAEQFGNLWEERDRILRRASMRACAIRAAGWLVFILGYAAAIALLIDRAVTGSGASVGDVLMAITIAGTMNGQVGMATGAATRLRIVLEAVKRYLWLEDFARERRSRKCGWSDPPAFLRDGLRLTNLTFRYRGAEQATLDGVNLHLPAGKTVAIVGENGAGKSTLVKLLCGLQRPTSGSITVDGCDLGTVHPDVWHRRISAGFQDFAKFEFLAYETVGLGDLTRIDDRKQVEKALRRAQAEKLILSLPNGLGTQVGSSFDSGVQLSTGQWQATAVGRAMMRDSPVLLVLDEPTASLDAHTEHALFEGYAAACRRLASVTGGITVLVSHRFSTVHTADIILVMRDGKIVESGNHAELMKSPGLYAELFRLQAMAYQ